MNERNDRDREIRDAFAASRRVERGITPGFREVREREPSAKPVRGGLRPALAGLAAAALLLVWLGLPTPPLTEPELTEEVRLSRQSTTAPAVAPLGTPATVNPATGDTILTEHRPDALLPTIDSIPGILEAPTANLDSRASGSESPSAAQARRDEVVARIEDRSRDVSVAGDTPSTESGIATPSRRTTVLPETAPEPISLKEKKTAASDFHARDAGMTPSAVAAPKPPPAKRGLDETAAESSVADALAMAREANERSAKSTVERAQTAGARRSEQVPAAAGMLRSAPETPSAASSLQGRAGSSAVGSRLASFAGLADSMARRDGGLVTTVERRPRKLGDIVVKVFADSSPLPGVTVTLGEGSRASQVASRVTDRHGRATFDKLPIAADYFVEVSFPGFEIGRRTGLTTWKDRTTIVAFDLGRRFRDADETLIASSGALVEAEQKSSASADGTAGRVFMVKKYVPPPGARQASKTREYLIPRREAVQGAILGDRNAESYATIDENGFRSVKESPLSTFSIDVDTASYANVRRFLRRGKRPPVDAVRIEELINYFAYDYPKPTGSDPFAADVDVIACPWNPEHRLARIGIRARDVSRDESPGSNLVFLIDVSGSMNAPDKLPLLRSAMSLLVEQLDGRDRVSIVVYAGASGLALPPTPGNRKADLLGALAEMNAGGSTNGGEGLRLAYKVARENFLPGGINRVILATDGDFNVGVTGTGDLLREIGDGSNDGIFLTALGFGSGNLADDRLEQLADRGNGNYAYIDSLSEARKVLVEQIGGTLQTLARDVKIQVEFNPLAVGAYRLIGYENRMLASEDFNDDRKDAGELGAGLTVTALYELLPPGSDGTPSVDPLRYGATTEVSDAAKSGELFTLKLRYKKPEGGKSIRVEVPVVDDGSSSRAPETETRFAAAVATFGMILRDSPHLGSADLDLVRRLARESRGPDERGYRTEFLELIETTAAID